MSWLEALLLGVLQGTTEFLPISSSGHLVIGQHILGIEVPGNAFEIVVHIGSLLSIIVVFRMEIAALIRTINLRSTQRYLLTLILATIPAGIVGIIWNEPIGRTFDNINFVSTMLIITGVFLFSTKFIKKGNKEINLGKGILIGFIQTIAILPGISRSGFTISTGLLAGISPSKAMSFSFLLAIPAISGAGMLMGVEMISSESQFSLSWSVILSGLISSFIVGWASLKWLKGILNSGKIHWFGYYCVAVALIIRII
jgi:undecaprenyl-diphosphatase